uniref:Uncharacterized protein n=1 Tax=Romanomermis culicivorax TaxID=13658 RepID=A0A915HK71_ROMCU
MKYYYPNLRTEIKKLRKTVYDPKRKDAEENITIIIGVATNFIHQAIMFSELEVKDVEEEKRRVVGGTSSDFDGAGLQEDFRFYNDERLSPHIKLY